MVVGIVVAVTGLLASFMWRDKLGRHISTVAMLLTIVVAAAEFVLFLLIQWSIVIHNRSECESTVPDRSPLLVEGISRLD
jgi:hypothetical protein